MNAGFTRSLFSVASKRLENKPLILVEAMAAGNDSGLGKHARMFVEALTTAADAADFIFLLPDGYFPEVPGTVLRPRLRSWKFFTGVQLPLTILRHRPDQVFCLGQSLPPWRPRGPKYLQLIPDAAPLERSLPFVGSLHNEYNRRWLEKRAPQADVVITSARFTVRRLEALLAIPRNKINVVRPIHPRHFNGAAESAPLGNIPDIPFFLAVGNLEPRKNFVGLVSAYAILRARRKEAPPLCLVGHKAWGHYEIAARVRELGIADAVLIKGHVSEGELREYFRRCRAFFSSSLYEGWGYPLFEALLHGVPSFYHAGSSQEEFASGLALAVDCHDTEAMAAAMETLWNSVEERNRLTSAMADKFPRIAAYDLAGALRECLGLEKRLGFSD